MVTSLNERLICLNQKLLNNNIEQVELEEYRNLLELSRAIFRAYEYKSGRKNQTYFVR